MDDSVFLAKLGLSWPAPDRITEALALPTDLDARIDERTEFRDHRRKHGA